jgi:hypothetical protein
VLELKVFNVQNNAPLYTLVKRENYKEVILALKFSNEKSGVLTFEKKYKTI